MPLVAHCARLCNLLIQECRYSEDISCFGCHALRGFEEVPGCSVSSSGGCRGERAVANQLARQCDAFTPSQLEDTKLLCHFFLNLVLTYGLIPTGSRFSCSSEANLLFELRRSPPCPDSELELGHQSEQGRRRTSMAAVVHQSYVVCQDHGSVLFPEAG